MEGVIKAKIKVFEDRFIDLRTSTCKELVNKGTSPQDLRITLMSLPREASDQHEKFIIDKYHIFEEAKTIEEIFVHLNFYLNFLNYNLLAHIIRNLRLSKNLRRKMNSYCEDIKLFQKETMTSDIIPHLVRKSTSLKGFSKLELDIDIDTHTTSLEDLEELRKQFANEFLLPDFALLLANIKKSSLLVVFLVPSAVVPTLKQEVKRKESDFFSKLHIIEISVDGAIVFGIDIQHAILHACVNCNCFFIM